MKSRLRSLVCLPLTLLGLLTLVATPWVRAQAPAPAQLLNLSVRKVVGPGENLIVGFAVAGNTPARILIRAIGPTLFDFGLRQIMTDPKIAFTYQANPQQSITMYNDNWNEQISLTEVTVPLKMKVLPIDMTGAFPLKPGSLDAALLVEVPAGAYTVTINSALSPIFDTGAVLAEIYHVNPSSDPNAGHLVNLSALGNITPDTPLIGGVVVGGASDSSMRLLARTSGPALTQFGVTGALADPKLELTGVDGTIIRSNDNWDVSPAVDAFEVRQASLQSGASPFPAGSRDAALIAPLKPGTYNLIATGVNGASGTALIEVYDARSAVVTAN
jgi:hypothetical protein